MKVLCVAGSERKPFIKRLILLSALLTLSAVNINAHIDAATQNSAATTITGPYNSGNLSVFMIHGKDQIQGQTYLTLQEALDQKKVVVHETGNVNNLSIDNLCGSVVFIQGGDIVKGGRQDRTMQQDMLLQPNQKNVALPAFCVEHGRWSGRGSESDKNFESANYALAGKQIKLAAKQANNQSDVWAAVSNAQSKLGRVLAKPVEATASPTSYELTLENKDVKQATTKIVQDLQKIGESDKDVVGYAFAINGKINSADVYASHDLFRKLWPKMLNASAVEAVTEGTNGGAVFNAGTGGKSVNRSSERVATASDVRKCLDEAEQAPKKKESEVSTQHSDVYSKEDGKNVVFYTLDKDRSVEVHKNYMNK
ncbi:MAG TPA: DUF6569 family protein [Oculatellaceae cyanobacterium]